MHNVLIKYNLNYLEKYPRISNGLNKTAIGIQIYLGKGISD